MCPPVLAGHPHDRTGGATGPVTCGFVMCLRPGQDLLDGQFRPVDGVLGLGNAARTPADSCRPAGRECPSSAHADGLHQFSPGAPVTAPERYRGQEPVAAGSRGPGLDRLQVQGGRWTAGGSPAGGIVPGRGLNPALPWSVPCRSLPRSRRVHRERGRRSAWASTRESRGARRPRQGSGRGQSGRSVLGWRSGFWARRTGE